MTKLMQSLNNILESVIDVTRKTLDPKIFNKQDDQYVMRPEVAGFLSNIIDEINNDIEDINYGFVKGSILSFQWLDETDVDLLLEIDKVSEDGRRKIQDQVDSKYDGVVIPNTKHPLQIYVQSGKYNYGSADGIYDLDKGWVKGPYNIAVNVDNYMDKFNKVVGSVDVATGELKRDIIDYNMLKKLPQDEIDGLSQKLKDKLLEINNTVDNIVFQYKHIKNMRHDAFREDMTPQDIAKYGTKNSLPENVIFKLMERYYYLKTMRDLKSIVEKSDIDTEEEVEQVNKSLKDGEL